MTLAAAHTEPSPVQLTQAVCTFSESCAAHFDEFVDTLAISDRVAQCRGYPQPNIITEANASMNALE